MTTGMWVGGAFRAPIGGGWRDLLTPATGAAVAQLPYGDGRDITPAVDAAATAGPAWAARTAYERGAILERAAGALAAEADTLAARTAEESGKPLAQARAEWLGAPNYLRQAAEEARRLGGRWIPARIPGRRIDVTYAPLGVVAVITAWNFPVYNPNRAVASALAAGNTVVLRPAEDTPRSAFDYARVLHEAGLPAGVLNVVHGDPASMGEAFLADPRVRKIAFTGSTRVGRLLMAGAAPGLKRLSLELGGRAPAILFADGGDPRTLARSAASARLRNAGQVCISPQRFIVEDRLADSFIDELITALGEERLGPPLDPTTTMGPLIRANQRDRVHTLVTQTLAAGAQLRCGGRIPDGPGWFYPPTVLEDVPAHSPCWSEEIFGPVFPVRRFSTEAEALRLAEDEEGGLAAFVFTGDLRRAFRISDALSAGLVGVNDWYPVTAEAPFGGVGLSGMGRESGSEGLLAYLESRTRYWG